jgi:hypothetical protein
VIEEHFGKETEVLAIYLGGCHVREGEKHLGTRMQTLFFLPSTSKIDALPSRYISSPGGCLALHFIYNIINQSTNVQKI